MKSCLDCGRTLSDNRKQRCRSCDNKNRWKDPEYKKNISEKLKGIPLKEETKLKMRQNHANVSGKNNPMFGVHRFGAECPSWIDGRSYEKYPKEFNDTLREKIRSRDNYECQNCSMTDEEHISVYGRHIEVHHIDYNRKNCKESNLITACKPCNIRFNKNREYWKALLNEKYKEKFKMRH